MGRLIVNCRTGERGQGDSVGLDLASIEAEIAELKRDVSIAEMDVKIAILEGRQARPLREAELARRDNDGAALAAAQDRIAALDAEISALRADRAALAG